MMFKFSDYQAADRKQCVLRLLIDSEAYSTNSVLLRDALHAVFGHNVSSDRMETDLTWLCEQGLVSIDRPGGQTIATLSTRGLDVAAGRAVVPGVKRPGPL